LPAQVKRKEKKFGPCIRKRKDFRRGKKRAGLHFFLYRGKKKRVWEDFIELDGKGEGKTGILGKILDLEEERFRICATSGKLERRKVVLRYSAGDIKGLKDPMKRGKTLPRWGTARCRGENPQRKK